MQPDLAIVCVMMMVSFAAAQSQQAAAPVVTTAPAPAAAQDIAREFLRQLIAGKVDDAERNCIKADELIEVFRNGEEQRPKIEESIARRRDALLRLAEALKDAQVLSETAGVQHTVRGPGTRDGSAMEQITGISFAVRKADGADECVRIGSLLKVSGLWWIVEQPLLGPPPVNPRVVDLDGGRKGVVADAPPAASRPAGPAK